MALEAVAYGRRYRPDPSPGVVFLPGLRLGKLNQARALGLRLGESRQGLVSSRISFSPSLNSILFPFASYSTYFDWLIPPASILVGGFVDDVFSFAVSEKNTKRDSPGWSVTCLS